LDVIFDCSGTSAEVLGGEDAGRRVRLGGVPTRRPSTRPVAIPEDVDDPTLIKVRGMVRLPSWIR
jgi:hypothetical protein